jgi:hemolysin activation/secretion protein
MQASKKTYWSFLCVALSASCGSHMAWAQVAPTDAGRTVEQTRPQPQPMPEGPQLKLPGSASVLIPAGGASVQLTSVMFNGNAHLSAEQIVSAMGGNSEVLKSYDLAGLRDLTDRITDFYRSAGYPFARAFLPAQDLKDGQLVIEIVEGRYGKVAAESAKEDLVRSAQPYLGHLVTGEVIAAKPIERATLLLNDLPGVTATPVMAPGTVTGSGDLSVLVEQDTTPRGGMGFDNHGSTYAGQWRARGDIIFNSVGVFGDQLSLSGVTPTPLLSTGSLIYAAPLGHDGLRLQIGHSRSSYQLSGSFDGFEGSAVINSATLSYPVIRSQKLNIGLSFAYQDKKMTDIRLTDVETKTALVVPLTLNFDSRDDVGGGGITYGSLSMAKGDVTELTGNKPFKRWTLDVARQQRLNSLWSLYGSLLAQGADSNLDSSEGISLGGPSRVRAYPSGESSGDEGWLLQAELRLSLGAWAPYAFYDHGKVRIDAVPNLLLAKAPDQERSGAGVGVRYQQGHWSMDLAMAQRRRGVAPQSDTSRDPVPRVWLQTRYAF